MISLLWRLSLLVYPQIFIWLLGFQALMKQADMLKSLLVSCVTSLISLPWSLCAVTTNSYRLGSLETIYIFLLNFVWRLESPRPRCFQFQSLAKVQFLIHASHIFTMSAHCREPGQGKPPRFLLKTILTPFMSSNFMI